MAKLRSVNTKFWDDSFIVELAPTEKLLFLYLITNGLTNLIGVYEVSMRRIKFDTGLPEDTIKKGLERLANAKKAFFVHSYVILPNWQKNQNLNHNMKKAVENEFEQLPTWLKDEILPNHSEGLPNDYPTIRNGLETIRELREGNKRNELKKGKETRKHKDQLITDFYREQMEAANAYLEKYPESESDVKQYKEFVMFLFDYFNKDKKNPGGLSLHKPLKNVLSIKEQLTFENFVKHWHRARDLQIDFYDKIRAMENHQGTRKYKDLNLTLHNWIKDYK